MIIVGAYPKSIDGSRMAGTPLRNLRELVARLPHRIALHILPFGAADGDGGFACRDWFAVDPSLGTWEDIEGLARQRRIVVDGIYNHVGLGHRWSREWLETGAGAERLHVFPFRPSQRVLSPRGASVFHPHQIQGRTWWAWQTFSPKAIDIQLGNRDVQATINRHQAFLANLGVWAVRLDSVAYYGKRLGERRRHHPLAIEYARSFAAIAQNYGLRVIPQLNCDTWGKRYFPISSSFDTPLTDFAYSAVLMLAILSGRPGPLVSHITRVLRHGTSVLRAMRTHDGILLKTSLLGPDERRELVSAFAEHHVVPRIVADLPYEFNCSFPYACSLGTDTEGMWRRLKMTTALTACLPGVCYVYLPILYGFQPELHTPRIPRTDPRELNRVAMPKSFVMRSRSASGHKEMLRLLDVLGSVREEFLLEQQVADDSIEQLDDSCVILRRAGGRLVLAANFARERSFSLPERLGQPLAGEGVKRGRLEPLGFGLWLR
jgi:hypothetical protein